MKDQKNISPTEDLKETPTPSILKKIKKRFLNKYIVGNIGFFIFLIVFLIGLFLAFRFVFSIEGDKISLKQAGVLLNYISSILSAFAACVFIRLWFIIPRTTFYRDHALFMWAVAMGIWGLKGILPQETIEIIKNPASLANSFFFIGSLYYFQHGGPDFNMEIFKKLNINEDNYLHNVFILGLTLTLISFAPLGFSHWLNLSISVLTLIFLGIGIFLSFKRRNLQRIGYISVLVILVTLIAQCISVLSRFNHAYDFPGTVALLIYKVNLIFIFGALSVTWLYASQVSLLDTQRRDMIHLMRNIFTNYKSDFSDLKELALKNEQKDAVIFYTENIIRLESLTSLFDEIHLKKFPKGVNLGPYLKRVLGYTEIQYRFEYNSFENYLPDTYIVRGDSAQELAKVITEFVINSYKYGNKWVRVICQLEKVKGKSDKLIVKIRNKGEVFDFDSVQRNFGMHAIRLYMSNLGAYEPEIARSGESTIIKLSFPLHKFIYNENIDS